MKTALLAWLDTHQAELTAIGSVSALLLLVTILATPWLVSLLPIDYFRSAKPRASTDQTGSSAWIALGWGLIRNITGAAFMVLGIAMLVLPGPGLVCFILGLSLCEFAGKQRFLRALIARYPSILTSLNWIRVKSGKEQLLPPDDIP